jgi:CheY-like chemotaxis protein
MAHVLIADSSREVAALLETLLASLGHDATSVDGLGSAELPQADLLFFSPADPANVELARAFRLRASGAAVVCMSALPPGEKVEALGLSGYLPKPFGLDALRDVVDSVLA